MGRDLHLPVAALDRFEAIGGLDALALSFPREASIAEIHRTMNALAP